MKKSLIITAVLGTAFIIYGLLRRKFVDPTKNLKFDMKPKHVSHHITDVFANAKKHSTS